jgi:hypothetical protein
MPNFHNCVLKDLRLVLLGVLLLGAATFLLHIVILTFELVEVCWVFLGHMGNRVARDTADFVHHALYGNEDELVGVFVEVDGA